MQDDDVKIFTKGAGENDEHEDFILLAEQLDYQRINGNIAKAKKLGKELALLTPENEPVKSIVGEQILAPAIMYQTRVLMVFVMQTVIHKDLLLPMLYSTAVNALFDRLIKESPEFYDNISDGAAFTFYYLALRKDMNVEQNIGEQFAMLCAREGNEKVARLGMDVFSAVTQVVVQKIKDLKFINDN